MFAKNNIWIGLLIGILMPIFVFGIVNAIISVTTGIKPSTFRTFSLVAICVNMACLQLPPIKIKKETTRGIAFMTMILAFAWFFYFGIGLLSSFE